MGVIQSLRLSDEGGGVGSTDSDATADSREYNAEEEFFGIAGFEGQQVGADGVSDCESKPRRPSPITVLDPPEVCSQTSDEVGCRRNGLQSGEGGQEGDLGGAEHSAEGLGRFLKDELDWRAPTTLQHLLYSNTQFQRSCIYKDLVNIFLSIARGLEHVHNNGSVHGNLNTSNVFINGSGRPNLVSPHASLICEKRKAHWNLVEPFGYLAPELRFSQQDGSDSQINEAVDIFALGVIMLECLTREPPRESAKAVSPNMRVAVDEDCVKQEDEGGKRESVVIISNSALRAHFIDKLNGESASNMRVWPEEFWSLIEQWEWEDLKMNEQQAAVVVLRRLRELVKDSSVGPSGLKWPPDLCLLVAECLTFWVEEGEDCVRRPTASAVVAQLEDMLEEPWVIECPPWVDQEDRFTALSAQLAPGSCCIDHAGGEIGGGAFARVWQGLYKDERETVQKVAIKVYMSAPNADEIAQKELEVNENIGAGHENVLWCFGGNFEGPEWDMQHMKRIEMEGHKNFLVMELMPQSLHDLVHRDKDFAETCTWERAIKIFIGIAEGLEFLHKAGIVYGHLHPSNVMIDRHGRPKLAGKGLNIFTLSRRLPVGTHGYIAPELLLPYNPRNPTKIMGSIDIFSLGAMMVEFATRKPPGAVDFGQRPREFWALVRDCCDYSLADADLSANRPSATEVVQRLQALQEQPWAEELLWRKPIFEEYSNNHLAHAGVNGGDLASMLAPGECKPYSPREVVRKELHTLTERGLYKDDNGEVHDVSIKRSKRGSECDFAKIAVHELHLQDKLDGDRHPNVLRCFGGAIGDHAWDMKKMKQIKMEGEDHFVVVEYAPSDLRKLLREDAEWPSGFTYRKMINVFRDIAAGLSHIHQNLIVHGYLEPSRVLISDDSRAKVTGFWASTRKEQRTISWRLAGTLGYIAPEIFYPKHNGTDFCLTNKIDIFAVGAMMVECLTHRHPHHIQCENAPEIWEIIENSCELEESDSGKSLVLTDDEKVQAGLLHDLDGKSLTQFPPWPREFWSLVEQPDLDGAIEWTRERIDELLKKLKELAKKPWEPTPLPWPPEICILIVKCLDCLVEDGKEDITRPSASAIADALKELFDKPWIDDLVPWVYENGKFQTHRPQCWFHSGDKLGEGAFGRVYAGIYEDRFGRRHEVAVKMRHRLDPIEALKNEFEVYQTLGAGHPNLVHCFGGSPDCIDSEMMNLERIEISEHRNFLVLELLPMNLHELLYNNDAFAQSCTYKIIVNIFLDIAKGLRFLHTNDIIHRDLKLKSILIDSKWRAKITDFDTSKIRLKSTLRPVFAGTLGYLPPEIVHPALQGREIRFTNSTDIFSFSVVMGECITRTPPTDLVQSTMTTHSHSALQKSHNVSGEVSGEVATQAGTEAPELWELIRQCRSYDQIDERNRIVRPSIDDVTQWLLGMLTMPWIDDPLPWVHHL